MIGNPNQPPARDAARQAHRVMLDDSKRAIQRTKDLIARQSQLFVVAAEVGAEAGPCAHAVPNLGAATALHGVSLSGFTADVLTIVPDLAWEQVEVGSRCADCTAELTSAE